MPASSAKRKAEPDVQLEDYAFNIFGHAMALPQEHREERVFVTALRSEFPCYEWQLRGPGRRPSAHLNEREKSAPTQGSKQYLLVGWVPGGSLYKYRNFIGRKGRSVGKTLLENVLLWDDKSDNVMVVAPILEAVPQTVTLYALVTTSNDPTSLRTAHPIDSEDVFYLPQYRDDSRI
ncbi:hypothetical protein BU16DRAFT_529868 [Lophium mytilinum]|uniref:Uncharacterized protein n=1 Tax=Lophium mytilinum TaxID=390894 RepID=A0A6A6QIN2_9PEZI|nr:hypothetical protein BU16DRAFT_529868 [Lophium mytilinum]